MQSWCNFYESIKPCLNSQNEHIHVIGTTFFNDHSIRLLKIEEDPFNIRYDGCVFVEPYEWGFDPSTIQVEDVIISRDMCGDITVSMTVNSNVKDRINNFYIDNIVDIRKEMIYYTLIDRDGNDHRVHGSQWRFMDG